MSIDLCGEAGAQEVVGSIPISSTNSLTLDDDVARRLQREKGSAWREVVNEVLRQGLAAVESGLKRPRRPYRTKLVSAGRLLIPTLDDIATALEIAEGEQHR